VNGPDPVADRWPRWPGSHVGPASIGPGQAPGGVVVHVYQADGTLITVRYLTPDTDLGADADDAVAGLPRSPPGTPVLLVIYDGDSGVRQ